MTELFENVRPGVKSAADIAWKIAALFNSPLTSVNFIDNVIKFYQHQLTDEEVEFLQFYFSLQMEMMKK